MSNEEALALAHILIILLVFALEIPVLIVEAAADDRIRHLLHKHVTHKVITGLMVLTLGIVVGLLFLTARSTALHRQGQVSTSALRPQGRGRLTIVAGQVLDRLEGVLTSGTTFRYGSIFVITMFGASWFFSMKVDVRKRLVADLERRLRRSFYRRGTFDKPDIDDLIAVGEASAPGYERDLIIGAIARTCRIVWDDEGYDGSQGALLVHSLERILRGQDHSGTAENVHAAVNVIRLFRSALVRRKMTGKPDARVLTNAVCAIGVLGLTIAPDSIASACFAAIPGIAVVPFRIGLAAVRLGEYRVAIAALTKLESFAEREAEPPNELIGLAAAFCEVGHSDAEIIKGLAERLRCAPVEIYRSALKSAEHFYGSGDFRTAAVVRQYARTLASGQNDGPMRGPEGRLALGALVRTCIAGTLVAVGLLALRKSKL